YFKDRAFHDLHRNEFSQQYFYVSYDEIYPGADRIEPPADGGTGGVCADGCSLLGYGSIRDALRYEFADEWCPRVLDNPQWPAMEHAHRSQFRKLQGPHLRKRLAHSAGRIRRRIRSAHVQYRDPSTLALYRAELDACV